MYSTTQARNLDPIADFLYFSLQMWVIYTSFPFYFLKIFLIHPPLSLPRCLGPGSSDISMSSALFYTFSHFDLLPSSSSSTHHTHHRDDPRKAYVKN